MNRTETINRLTTVKVRMSDSAVLGGAVSLLYAFGLMACPRAFPELLARIFGQGYFFPALALLLVTTNEILFVVISSRRHQKPGLLTPGYVAFLTIAVIFGFWLLVGTADLQTQLSHLVSTSSRARDGISSEELLVYTYLAMVSGVFLPYLMVRMTQNYVSNANSADQDARVRNATAGQ